MTEQKKFISACIIGKPNAGKSTLLNQLIGQKISIVTPKVQTTRTIITGITTIKDAQVVFFDTPGLFEPKKTLEKAMVKCAWSSLNNADIIILVLDCTEELDASTTKIISFLKDKYDSIIFVLNKLDVLSRAAQKELRKENPEEVYTKKISLENYLKENFKSPIIVEISALTGFGIKALIEYIYSKAKPSGWIYQEDEITTLPMRFLAAEITREQLFLNLHQELPYNLTVFTESWEELDDGYIKINQTILVSKQNYKAMILGKKGETIKRIGSKAREEINKAFDINVHLFLFVKVEENWQNSPAFYEYTGLKPV